MVKLDKDIFNTLISKFEIPEYLDQNSIEKILKEYPAFNSLELLNAVLLKKYDQTLLDKTITKTATRVLDRKILHDLIYKDLISFKITEVKKEIKEKSQDVIEKVDVPKVVAKEIKTIEISKDLLRKSKIKEIDISKKHITTKKINLKENIKQTKVVRNIPKIVEIHKQNPIEDRPQISSKEENRDDAFQKLSNDLFKDKLNAKKENTDKENRRLDAMKKLQEELFNKKLQKAKTPKKSILSKKPKDSIKGKFEKIINTQTSFDANSSKETIAEKKAKALILKIKEQQEALVKDEEVKHLEKIELLKKKLLEKKLSEKEDKIKNTKKEILLKKEEEKHLEKSPIKKSLQERLKSLHEKIIKEKIENKKKTDVKLKETKQEEIQSIKKISIDKAQIKRVVLEKETVGNVKGNKEIEKVNLKIKKTQNSKIEETKSIAKKTEVVVKKGSFLDWLKKKETIEKNIETKEKEKSLIAVNKKTKTFKKENYKEEQKEDIIPFDRTSAIEAEMHKEIKKSSDPLDSFLSKQIAKKKIVKQKKETNTSQKHKFATETLAGIYLAQQKYNEAIEVYTTLSIKYPQKSVYFARQIEKIKTYL